MRTKAVSKSACGCRVYDHVQDRSAPMLRAVGWVSSIGGLEPAAKAAAEQQEQNQKQQDQA